MIIAGLKAAFKRSWQCCQWVQPPPVHLQRFCSRSCSCCGCTNCFKAPVNYSLFFWKNLEATTSLVKFSGNLFNFLLNKINWENNVVPYWKHCTCSVHTYTGYTIYVHWYIQHKENLVHKLRSITSSQHVKNKDYNIRK